MNVVNGILIPRGWANGRSIGKAFQLGPLPAQLSCELMDQVIGYLNFSTGAVDLRFLANMDQLFACCGDFNKSHQELCSKSNARARGFNNGCVSIEYREFADRLKSLLNDRIDSLQQSNSTFADATQSRSVIELVFGRFLDDYRNYHRDLLFHQCDWLLFNSFFMGRACEAVLLQGGPWHESERIVFGAIEELNDFIGHRPIATLESQKIEPYAHEWVRPIPMYIAGVGIAQGPYRQIISQAMDLLRQTPASICRSAHFDMQRLNELAIDPRAFDFDHPINRRPNHHFGQWDEHLISQEGFYERFILHQVTLDSLLERVTNSLELEFPDDNAEQVDHASARTQREQELMFEASAVLAGTMLMASGINGYGPGAHDSTVTLGNLLPIIAGYRDDFYQDWIKRVPEEHQQRLLDEASKRLQPFGGVRQDLNAQLAKKRASQLVNCRLAAIFARMGYPEAAEQQSQVVPVASSRILCQIDCLLSQAHYLVKPYGSMGKREPTPADLEHAIANIPAAFSLLQRGIECGAIVDPWNILGFDGNYSLFPATENSVTDHRVFDLVEFVERVLELCSHVWSESAAHDLMELCDRVREEFEGIVDWWRKYAAHQISSVDAVDPDEIFSAAELVAKALNLWHKGGAEAGDIAFWSEHASLFDSPNAYALVIDALMQRHDYVTSMALMVHWLGQAEHIGLQQADSSFHLLVNRWITEQKDLLAAASLDEREMIWSRIQKFYDFLEANAEHYWDVPKFQLDLRRSSHTPQPRDTHPENDEPPPPEGESLGESDHGHHGLFEAAYEDFVYVDSTNDGFEGSVFDSAPSDDELKPEVERVMDRLEFHGSIANYWRIAATVSLPAFNGSRPSDEVCARLAQRRDIFEHWVAQAKSNRRQLDDLLESVHSYQLPLSGTDHESMIQYDRHRLYKESLLELAINTTVAVDNAVRMLNAVIHAANELIEDGLEATVGEDGILITLFSALLCRNADGVDERFPPALEYFQEQKLLYVPLSKGGDPNQIVEARVVQSTMMDLMANLPALGLIEETYALTCAALEMERNHGISQGAVTEFDEMFKVAYSASVHALVESTRQLKQQLKQAPEPPRQEIKQHCENELFDCIEKLTEAFLVPWLEHSKSVRLSVLEKVRRGTAWNELVEFIQRYGDGLFTQQFLHLANIRAILHQGIDRWLGQVLEMPDVPDLRLFDELQHGLPRTEAVDSISIILEALVENYNYYRDYNTTTTQSDRGSLTYILLDFLRLRGDYERVCWNLKPVIWAHEILVRDQENVVAKMWRRSLTEKVGPKADNFILQLQQLRQKYSVQMVSIGRRLEERFGHPMQIDRLRAHVGPAMKDPADKKCRRTFERLHQETQAFTRTTMGVGMDIPGWLAALENEVDGVLEPDRISEKRFLDNLVEPLVPPMDQIRRQLQALPGPKQNSDLAHLPTGKKKSDESSVPE